ncbi:unnamed protein product [Ectocarpus sp. CCAP 1310/34]|nr:unnamed protein product [Ectocarpus sp. CCAP 1310/34]
MPCAEGDLCRIPDRTPQVPNGHVCRGRCGGRLHGECGSMFDDSELNRICSTCVANTGKRKARAAEGAGKGQSKRPKAQEGSKNEARKRLDVHQKVEILKLVDAKLSQGEIADRFGCSERLIRKVKAERERVENEAAEEEGGSDDENAGRGRRAPPGYADLSYHFGYLETAAEESGNGDAVHHLSKARTAMIAAHTAKRARQADMREFIAT